VLFKALTGAQQRWLATCVAAVAGGPDSTRELLADNSAEARVLTSQSLRPDYGAAEKSGSDESLLEDEAEDPATTHPHRANIDLSAAHALASLACGLTGALDPEEACENFLRHAERAGQHSIGTQLLPAGTSLTSGNDRLGAMILHLLGRGDRPGRGYGILTALQLTGQRPKRVRRAQISVLFGSYNGRRGVAGRLHLEHLSHGPSGLHPDPASMAFLHADDEFTQGLHTSWAATPLAHTDACVLWSIGLDHGAPANTIIGGSLSAAFAVALDDLAPRTPSMTRLPVQHLRVRRLDPRCAVTAGLHDTGSPTTGRYRLTIVDRYADKLAAAQRNGLRVVVAADAEAIARNAAPPDYAHRITGADTLYQAIRHTRTRTNYRLWAIVAALVLIATTSAVVLYPRAGSAAANSALIAAVAEGRRDIDPALSQQLALAAYQTSPTVEARSALIDSTAVATPVQLTVPQLTDFAVTRTGNLIASAALDGTVQFTAITDTGLRLLHTFTADPALSGVALSPNGRLLLTCAETGIALWNIRNPVQPQRITTLAVPTVNTSGFAFSPDSTQVAVGTGTGHIQRWNIAEPDHPTTLTTMDLPPQDLPSSPNTIGVDLAFTGTVLAAARHGGTTLRTWNLTGNRDNPPPTDTPLDDTVQALAGSTDGTTLALAGATRIQLRHIDTPQQISRTQQTIDLSNNGTDNGTIAGVSFSTDGTRVAAASDTGTTIWSLATSTLTRLPSRGSVSGVRFTRDDHTLVTLSRDAGMLQVWALPGPALPPTPNPIVETPIDASGTTMLVGTNNTTVANLSANAFYLWDLTNPSIPRQTAVSSPTTHPDTGIVAIAADGTLAAIAAISPAGSNSVQLWRIADHSPPVPVGPLIPVPEPIGDLEFLPGSKVLFISAGRQHFWNISNPANPSPLTTRVSEGYGWSAISPDGRLLAYGIAEHGIISLWDISDPSDPKLLQHITGLPRKVLPFTFAHAGRQLALDTGDTIRLYDLADPLTPRHIATIDSDDRDSGVAGGLNYSPDDHLLEKPTQNNGIWIWNVTNPNHPTAYATLHAEPGVIKDAQFLGHADQLTAADQANMIRLWTLDTDRIRQTICDNNSTPITDTEWRALLPGIPMPTLCS